MFVKVCVTNQTRVYPLFQNEVLSDTYYTSKQLLKVFYSLDGDLQLFDSRTHKVLFLICHISKRFLQHFLHVFYPMHPFLNNVMIRISYFYFLSPGCESNAGLFLTRKQLFH